MTSRRTRLLDLTLLVVGAPLWVPLMISLGLVVLLSSGSPIFFRQDRVGRGGAVFSMVKFRSMVCGDNPLVPDPNRVTPAGRLLRRSSLDELPQLLNVLRGDMSLVGPRPMLPSQTEAMSPAEKARHTVRPGLTGLAQVNGRNSLLWEERFHFDLEWANAPFVRTYLAILARTIRVVAMGDGVSGHDASDRFVEIAEHDQKPGVVRLVDFDLTRVAEDSPHEHRTV